MVGLSISMNISKSGRKFSKEIFANAPFFSKMFEAKSFFDKAALLPLFKSMTSLSIILG